MRSGRREHLRHTRISHILTFAVPLQGGYVEPGPGGDPIRNPAVLPTGKNIHALDPQSIPTQAAVKSARIVVERCSFSPCGSSTGVDPHKCACGVGRCMFCLKVLHLSVEAAGVPKRMEQMYEGLGLL